MSKITKFPTTAVEEEETPVATARFPDMPTIESMLLGKPLQSILLLTVNSDGDVSHYVDGATTMEALGMLEMLKQAVFLSDLGYEEE